MSAHPEMFVLVFLLVLLPQLFLCQTTLPPDYYFSMEESNNPKIINIQSVNLNGNVDLSSLEVLTKSPNTRQKIEEEGQSMKREIEEDEIVTKVPTDADGQHLMDLFNGTSGTLTTEKLIIVTPLKLPIDEGLFENIQTVTANGFTTEETGTKMPENHTQLHKENDFSITTTEMNETEKTLVDTTTQVQRIDIKENETNFTNNDKTSSNEDQVVTNAASEIIENFILPEKFQKYSTASEEIEDVSSFLDVDERLLSENVQKSEDNYSIENLSAIMNDKEDDSLYDSKSLFQNEDETLEKLGSNGNFPKVPGEFLGSSSTEKTAETTTSEETIQKEIQTTTQTEELMDVERIFSRSNLVETVTTTEENEKDLNEINTEEEPEDLAKIFTNDLSVENSKVESEASTLSTMEIITKFLSNDISTTTTEEKEEVNTKLFTQTTEYFRHEQQTTLEFTSEAKNPTTLFKSIEEDTEEISTRSQTTARGVELVQDQDFTTTTTEEKQTTLEFTSEDTNPTTLFKTTEEISKQNTRSQTTAKEVELLQNQDFTTTTEEKSFATTSEEISTSIEDLKTVYSLVTSSYTPNKNNLQTFTENEENQYFSTSSQDPSSTHMDFDLPSSSQIEKEEIIPTTIVIEAEISNELLTTTEEQENISTILNLVIIDNKDNTSPATITISTSEEDLTSFQTIEAAATNSEETNFKIPQFNTTVTNDSFVTTSNENLQTTTIDDNPEVTTNNFEEATTSSNRIESMEDEEMMSEPTTALQTKSPPTKSEDTTEDGSSLEEIVTSIIPNSKPNESTESSTFQNISTINSFDYVIEDNSVVETTPQDFEMKKESLNFEKMEADLTTTETTEMSTIPPGSNRGSKELPHDSLQLSSDMEETTTESLEALQSDDPISTTLDPNFEETETSPEIVGRIRNEEVRFSVKITGDDLNFFIPPDAFLTFRQPNALNITWKSSDPHLNNSLALNLDKFEDSLELRIVKAGRMLVVRSAPENKSQNASVIALECGIRVHFSNIDFRQNGQEIVEAGTLPSTLSHQKKALAAEIMGGCIGFAVVLGIIVYFTVQRYRGRTRTFKPNAPA